MNKRIAKKTARRFLAGNLTPGIRIEPSVYDTDGKTAAYEAFAVLPKGVAKWAEILTGACGRLDTPLYLGGIGWYGGEFIRNPGWEDRWESDIRRKLGVKF